MKILDLFGTGGIGFILALFPFFVEVPVGSPPKPDSERGKDGIEQRGIDDGDSSLC